MQYRDKKARFLCAALLLLMFLAGLIVSPDYGIPADESQELAILLSNMREYIDPFFDNDSAIINGLDQHNIIKIRDNIEQDHGQAAYYLLFPMLFLKYARILPISDYVLSQTYHGYTYILCFSSVLAVYLIAMELFKDRKTAILCALILFVTPRFFAESHYNNKDMVLLCLLIDESFFAIKAIRHKGIFSAAFFGFFAALAANSKIIGLFFFAAWGLCFILYSIIYRQWSRKSIQTMVAAIASFAFFYYLLTPAMWGRPVAFFSHSFNEAFSFSRWNGSILFDGEIYDPIAGELPRRYLPELIFLTTPLFILLLAAIGFIRIIVVLVSSKGAQSQREQVIFVLTCVFCTFVPLLISVVKRSIVYNGWRHFYFSYWGIVILAMYGTDWLIRNKFKYASFALFCLVVLNAVGLVINHPNQYAYYNILAGNVEARYETDYWGLSSAQALKTIVDKNSEAEMISVSFINDPIRLSMILAYTYFPDEYSSRIWIETDPTEAEYILVNLTKAAEYGNTIPDGFILMDTISAYGNDIAEIYAREDK